MCSGCVLFMVCCMLYVRCFASVVSSVLYVVYDVFLCVVCKAFC